jgi:membrane-associated phospholipid phosphatase
MECRDLGPKTADTMEYFTITVIGSLIVLAASFIRRDRDKYPAVCVAVMLPVFSVLMCIPLRIVSALHPHTVDALLYRVDLAMGLNPVAVYQFVQRTAWLKTLVDIAYFGLPLPVAIGQALERPRVMLRAMILASIIAACVCYNLVPAVGPVFALADPMATNLKWLAEPGVGARNCFPSMHLGCTLLLAWNLRGRVLKSCAWIYVALTALATIGTGQHYFIDLIAAVPFCWAIQTVAEMPKLAVPRFAWEKEEVKL